MARVSATKVSGTSRVRFIMLDAELANGDLSQVTQAIQNALRPPTAPNQRFVASTTTATNGAATAKSGTENAEADEPEGDVAENAITEEPLVETSSDVSKPRKFRTPKVLDVDLETATSFQTFAEEKNPSSDLKRFLVVAAWFKLHRNIDAITVDHVYTCYRAVKWPTAIQDFSLPLRQLKHKQLVTGGAGKGLYAINHLGLAEVDKLG